MICLVASWNLPSAGKDNRLALSGCPPRCSSYSQVSVVIAAADARRALDVWRSAAPPSLPRRERESARELGGAAQQDSRRSPSLQGLQTRPVARNACIPDPPILGDGLALIWGPFRDLAVPSGCPCASFGSIGRHLARLPCISLCFILEVSLPPLRRLASPNPSLCSFGHRRSPALSLVITLAGRRGIFRSQKKLRVHQCSRN